MLNLLGTLVLMSAAPAKSVSLEEVQALIAEKGPRGTIHQLFEDDERWDQFLEIIATGKKEWLTIAAQLRPATDAHASETLDMALQEALPRNPAGVLDLVATDVVSVSQVCGMYGFGQIEDERPNTVLVALVDKRIAAVSALKQPTLSGVRNACLEELQALRVLLEKSK